MAAWIVVVAAVSLGGVTASPVSAAERNPSWQWHR